MSHHASVTAVVRDVTGRLFAGGPYGGDASSIDLTFRRAVGAGGNAMADVQLSAGDDLTVRLRGESLEAVLAGGSNTSSAIAVHDGSFAAGGDAAATLRLDADIARIVSEDGAFPPVYLAVAPAAAQRVTLRGAAIIDASGSSILGNDAANKVQCIGGCVAKSAASTIDVVGSLTVDSDLA